MEYIKAAHTQYNAPEDFHEKSDMKMVSTTSDCAYDILRHNARGGI